MDIVFIAKFWGILNLVAILLLIARKDASPMLNDMLFDIFDSNVFSSATYIVFYYIVLPISIPSSLITLYNRWKNK